MTDIEYSSATGEDHLAIQALSADCRLPADGIELVGDNCLVAKVDSNLVGMVALEPYGRAGLFRSLAVAPDYRGPSLGRSLCARMVSAARLLGVERLYLLTTDADRYLGFTSP